MPESLSGVSFISNWRIENNDNEFSDQNGSNELQIIVSTFIEMHLNIVKCQYHGPMLLIDAGLYNMQC